MSVLRSIYAWLLIAVIVLPLFPVVWLRHRFLSADDSNRSRLRIFVARWVSLYGHLTPLYRFEITGRPRLDALGPAYVLVANHESGIDVLCLFMLRTPTRFLAESYLFRLPLVGGVMRACRHISVKPGDKDSGRRALERAESALAEGEPVAIYPEGEISPDGLAPFRPGAFVAAKRAGVPIAPVLIRGAAAAWQPDRMVVEGQHRVRIDVLPAVPADRVEKLEVEELIAEVRGAFEQGVREDGSATSRDAATSR